MTEPLFEPNDEPLDENRIVEGLDDDLELLDDDELLPEEVEPGAYAGGHVGHLRVPERYASDVEPTPHDPRAGEGQGGNEPV
jgi:hypothetical protein